MGKTFTAIIKESGESFELQKPKEIAESEGRRVRLGPRLRRPVTGQAAVSGWPQASPDSWEMPRYPDSTLSPHTTQNQASWVQGVVLPARFFSCHVLGTDRRVKEEKVPTNSSMPPKSVAMERQTRRLVVQSFTMMGGDDVEQPLHPDGTTSCPAYLLSLTILTCTPTFNPSTLSWNEP